MEYYLVIIGFIVYKIYRWIEDIKIDAMYKTKVSDISIGKMTEDLADGVSKQQIRRNMVNGKYNVDKDHVI